MADLVPPVRPLVKHAKALEAALRREFLRPMYHSFAEPLARATAAAQAFVVMDQVVEAIQGLPRNGVPLELIQKHLDTLEGYHRERVGKVFQSALGVNVRQLLTRPAVAAFMAERLGENVALISTIPSRFHDGLRSRLAQALTEKPFDRSLLTKVVGEEFKASGYQLRRIVRDQTTKAIGGLTEIRQKQLGMSSTSGSPWATRGCGSRTRPTAGTTSCGRIPRPVRDTRARTSSAGVWPLPSCRVTVSASVARNRRYRNRSRLPRFNRGRRGRSRRRPRTNRIWMMRGRCLFKWAIRGRGSRSPLTLLTRSYGIST